MMNDLVVVLSVIGFTLSLAAAAWLLRTNYRLAAENERLLLDKRLLQIGCDESRARFARYAQLHLAKNTPEGDRKAHANTDMAERLSQVLEDTDYQEVGLLQQALLGMRRQFERLQANG
jgi:hypothetical protein